MPSKLDEYLKNASDKKLNSIKESGKIIGSNANSIEETNTSNIEPPSAKPAEQVNMGQPKLDENTAKHIQSVNNAQGNNYLNQSTQTTDSLAKYSDKHSKEQENQSHSLEKDNEQER